MSNKIIEKTFDLILIQQLDKKCFKNYYSIKIYQEMDLKINKFYLIKLNDLIVGFIIFSYYEHEYEIIKIGIIPTFRKQNLAFKAINYFINNFEWTKILLEVSEINLAAIKLYKKLEFKIISKRKNYYADNSDALIMEKIKE